jgi:hypothetical protein
MGCVGCGSKKTKIMQTQDEKVAKMKKWLEFRQRNKCLYCGGVIEIKSGGIEICISCRKRKK